MNAARLAELWRVGAPVSAMLAEADFSKATLYRRVAQLGLPPRDPVKRAIADGIEPGAVTLARVSILERTT
jgi:hypothetical protein